MEIYSITHHHKKSLNMKFNSNAFFFQFCLNDTTIKHFRYLVYGIEQTDIHVKSMVLYLCFKTTKWLNTNTNYRDATKYVNIKVK